MTQNGCSGPMTTVLDRDWTTVSTQLPFLTGRNIQALAETADACPLAEADQVQAGDAGQPPRELRELARNVEARLPGVGRPLAAPDRSRGNRTAGPVPRHAAKRAAR